MAVNTVSEKRMRNLKLARWRARTDLLWLCNEILSYKDVSERVHGPVLARLQHFPRPSEEQMEANDRFENGTWKYKPLVPMLDLEGKRRLLILDYRGGLKTTVNAISHSIQWIINYPDCAIAILQANLDKANDIISEIKNHFTKNPRFRELFPEHCPVGKKIDNFGTQEEFTTLARGFTVTRKEPTVRGASIEKGLAGSHFDIMKYSDIVDETNSNNAESCLTISKKFNLSQNLLVSPIYWIDVEGTRYDEKDTYGVILRGEDVSAEENREWKVFVRGIFKKDTKGKPRTYTYDEVKLPDLLDENGVPISVWPERFPSAKILASYNMDPYIVSCQQYNYPNAGAGGQIVFPVNEQFPAWKSRRDFDQRVLVSYYEIRVDTAETNNERSNHSVITTGAWDAAGRLYIVDIRRGKWLGAELIANIVATYLQYKAKSKNGFVRVGIEETGFVRGLMLGFMQYCQQRDIHIPLVTFPVNNTKSKTANIINTLQYPYKTKNIIFLDDLKEKDTLIKELEGMPRPLHDDILDTLAAFYTGKEWLGRTAARAAEEGAAGIEQILSNAFNEEGVSQLRQRAFAVALGFREDINNPGTSIFDPNYAKTGGL